MKLLNEDDLDDLAESIVHGFDAEYGEEWGSLEQYLRLLTAIGHAVKERANQVRSELGHG